MINNYDEEEKVEVEEFIIKVKEIESNIKFFLKWAGVASIVLFIFAIINFIVAIANSAEMQKIDWASLITAISFLISSAIVEQVLKWFAYMLYTNYKKR